MARNNVGLYSSDILTGGIATADTEATPASNAVDNNEGTYWQSSGAFPHWWKYDLGEGVTKRIGKLRIKPGYSVANQRLKDFVLAGSTDDSNYVDLYLGQHADNIDWEEYIIPNYTAYRYPRITITNSWEGDVIANIYEMEMMEVTLRSSASARTTSSTRTVASARGAVV